MCTLVVKKQVKKKKKTVVNGATRLTMFRAQLRSRHPSHSWLRHNMPLLPFRSVVRLGSTTELADTVAKGGRRVECNSVQSIKNSASKLLMKQCFAKAGVKTADWYTYNNGFRIKNEAREIAMNELPYPIIAKSHYGSRGEGNTKLDTRQELETWIRGKTINHYIFEKFYNFAREYRLHVTANGCFYTNRKLRRSETPEEDRWFFNDSNSNWMLETNPLFDKPNNWRQIEAECVKALKAVGLDIGGFDVKVQSSKDGKERSRENPDFIILESGSACSHGDVTRVKYKEQLERVLREKYTNRLL